MGNVSLTKEERMILLQLSYKDMTEAGTPCSFEEMLKRMASKPNQYNTTDERTGQTDFCLALRKDMQDNPSKYPNLATLQLTDYENDNGNSGYVGYAFEDPSGKHIVLSRGSEDADRSNWWDKDGADWANNFTGNGTQGPVAQRFFEKNVDKGDTVLAIGHSLGGGIALMLVSQYQDDYDIEAYVLNSAYFEAMRNLPGGKRPPDHDKVHSVCSDSDSLAASARTVGVIPVLNTAAVVGGGISACTNGYHDESVPGEHTVWPSIWKYKDGAPVYAPANFMEKLDSTGGLGKMASGPPILVDTAVLLQLAGKVRHAITLGDSVDHAIDNLGKTLAKDALEIQRDGNVNESLGRGANLPDLPPKLASLIGGIRGSAVNLFIDIKSFFDGGLNTNGLTEVESYLRVTAQAFEASEDWILGKSKKL